MKKSVSNRLKVEHSAKESVTVLYNSMGGEWIEIDKEEKSLVHQMFWLGSGYMASHIHAECEESFIVKSGVAYYEINDVRYKAKEGDVITFPKGVKHVNPYNASTIGMPLVVYSEKLCKEMVDFYELYYSLVTKEVFIKNRHGLPTKLQYLALNQLLKLKTKFCILPAWKEKLFDLLYGNDYAKYLSR